MELILMLLPFACPRCKKDKWMIRYNSDDKYHEIECAQCGYVKILEEIFGAKKKTKLTTKTQQNKAVVENIQTQETD